MVTYQKVITKNKQNLFSVKVILVTMNPAEMPLYAYYNGAK